MSLIKRRCYVGTCLLLITLGCSACASNRLATETQITAQDNKVRDDKAQDKPQNQAVTVSPYVWQHGFDKTEVDLEYGRPLPASFYHQPRVKQLYTFDGTETDLSHAIKSNDVKRTNPSPSP